MISGSIQG